MNLQQLFAKKDIHKLIEEASTSNTLKRTLTTTNLVALGIGAIVGTGIFVITGQSAAMYAGPALTISFVISAIACLFAGLCYAELAAMIPVSGSIYSYAYATIGEFIAWFIGWDLILEYMFVCSTVAVGWSAYVENILANVGVIIPHNLAQSTLDHTAEGWFFTGSIINFPAMFIIVILTTFHLLGTKSSAQLNNIIVIIKVAVILLFIGFGLFYVDTSNWIPYIPENTGEFGQYGWSGIFRGAAVVFLAYLGFDALSTTAQEAINPQKTMPRGILISLAICVVLYIAVTAIMTGIVPYKELNVAAPIALAIDRAGEALSWISPIIKIGAIAGMTSVLLVMLLGTARIYYAISRDNLLPSFLSKVTKKGSPINAQVIAGVSSSIIAGLLPLHILAELVSVGTMLAFIIVCIAIIFLRKVQPDLPRPFKVPLVPLIPILGALVCLVQIVSLPLVTIMRLLAWAIIGCIIYFVYGSRHSKLKIR
jgi:APA family basic amino acid/polyamine antiporter